MSVAEGAVKRQEMFLPTKTRWPKAKSLPYLDLARKTKDVKDIKDDKDTKRPSWERVNGGVSFGVLAVLAVLYVLFFFRELAMSQGFIPPHGSYKKLLSYQKAEIV